MSKTLLSHDKIQNQKHKHGNQFRMSGAHVQSPALHAHGRSATPLPLFAGKQQTRELTPSKINTITEYIYSTIAGRYIAPCYRWNIHGTSNKLPMGHNGTSMEQSSEHMSIGHSSI